MSRSRGGAACRPACALVPPQSPAQGTLYRLGVSLIRRSAVRALRGGLVVLAAVVVGCASTPSDAPSCCRTLAELPYRPVADGSTSAISIDAQTPSFDFAGGPSRFVAFRLPEGPRPLLIDVAAPVALLPGSLKGLLDQRSIHFPPLVWLLDADHRVVRQQAIGFERIDCLGRSTTIAGELAVAEPPAAATYLVVSADPARLSASPERLCGGQLTVEFPPVGQVRIRVEGLPVTDQPVALQAQGRWFPGTRRVGFAQDYFTWDTTPGRLVLGAERLHYLERTPSGLKPRLALPVDRIVSVSSDMGYPSDQLVVGVADDQHAVHWHAFTMPRAQAGVHAPNFAGLLEQRLLQDVVVESVAFRAEPWTVAVDVVSAADRRAGGRVGDAAVAGGVVAALPCGLCQVGGCTPEVLVTCAAAFTVGATLGGAWAVGKELLGGSRDHSATASSAPPIDQRAAAGAVAAGAAGTFDASALQGCLSDAVARIPQGVWREQGWTARLQRGPAAALLPPATARREARVDVTRIALVHEAGSATDRAPADIRAWLQIDARVLLGAADEPGPAGEPFSWVSEQRTLGQWAEADTARLRSELSLACVCLASQAVSATEKAWRRR